MFSGTSLLFVMMHQGHLFAFCKDGAAVGLRIKQKSKHTCDWFMAKIANLRSS